MQIHLMKRNGKYFYRFITGYLSHISLDDLIVEDFDSTIDDIMFVRHSLFVGVVKKHLVCVESTFITDDGIEVDGSTRITSLNSN